MKSRFLRLMWREIRRDLPRPFRQFWDDVAGFFGWITLHWLRFRRALRNSPEWYFAVSFGFLGLVLTLLLFLSLPSDPPVEQAALVTLVDLAPPPNPDDIDSRLAHWEAALVSVDRSIPIEVLDGPSMLARDYSRERVSPFENWAPEPERLRPTPVDDDPFANWQVQQPATSPDLDFLAEYVGLKSLPAIPRLGAPSTQTAASSLTQPSGITSVGREELADLGNWSATRFVARPATVQPIGYAERNFAKSGELAPGWDDDAATDVPGSQPSHAEMALRIQVDAPSQANQFSRHRSKVLIENRGDTPLSTVRILEPLAHLETVVDAVPPARVTDQSLERELWNVAPDATEDVELEWIPQRDQSLMHSVLVAASTQVSTTTQVGPADPIAAREPEPVRVPQPLPDLQPRQLLPGLACRPEYTARVPLNGVWEMNILVSNTGEVELTDVRVLAAVPNSLLHRHGALVECPVGRLSPGESRTVKFRALADRVGMAVSQLVVICAENVSAVESASTEIVTSMAQPSRGGLSQDGWIPRRVSRRTLPADSSGLLVDSRPVVHRP